MTHIPKKNFGSTSVPVGQMGFGAMSLAGLTKAPVEQEKVNAILQECLDNGVNVIDTSDIYTQTATQQLGYGEKQIGHFLAANKERRKDVFLCTKFAMRFIDGATVKDNSAKWCLEACKDSLQRLQVDYIDLYYCHRYDGKTDPKETAKAMKQLKDEGKIKFVGVSEFPIEKLKQFNEVCHVDAVQNEFSPFTPEVLRLGIIEWCEQNGTAYVAYSPLGRGVFTGSVKRAEDVDPMYQKLNLPRLTGENFDKNVKLVEKVESIANKKGVKPGHVTLAWVIAKSPMIIPIPGTSKLENLKDNIAASKTQLTQEEIKSIDEIVYSFDVSGQRYFGAGNDNLSH